GIVAGVINVKHAVRACRVDIEEPGLRAETRRRPVCRAPLVWRDEHPVCLWVLFGVWHRLALFVVPGRPVRLDVLRRDDGRAVGPIEHEEVAGGGRLSAAPSGLAA